MGLLDGGIGLTIMPVGFPTRAEADFVTVIH